MGILGVPAMGAWNEDFQSYALGSQIGGQGGWAGWDGGVVNATVSDAYPKFAGDKMVLMTANDDLVQEYSGYTSGQWVFSAMQYIPSDHVGDVTFFIMMNKYTLASKGWSVQMKFDYNAGVVTDDESAQKPGVPIVYDQWNEIRVMIDLDANTQSTYYNGAFVGTADWYEVGNTDHLKSIAALDLWGDSGGGRVGYDDLSLVAVPEPSIFALGALAAAALTLFRRRIS